MHAPPDVGGREVQLVLVAVEADEEGDEGAPGLELRG